MKWNDCCQFLLNFDSKNRLGFSKELSFCHKRKFSNFFISLHPDCLNLSYFKLSLFDLSLTEFLVWNIKGLRYMVCILDLEAPFSFDSITKFKKDNYWFKCGSENQAVEVGPRQNIYYERLILCAGAGAVQCREYLCCTPQHKHTVHA